MFSPKLAGAAVVTVALLVVPVPPAHADSGVLSADNVHSLGALVVWGLFAALVFAAGIWRERVKIARAERVKAAVVAREDRILSDWVAGAGMRDELRPGR